MVVEEDQVLVSVQNNLVSIKDINTKIYKNIVCTPHQIIHPLQRGVAMNEWRNTLVTNHYWHAIYCHIMEMKLAQKIYPTNMPIAMLYTTHGLDAQHEDVKSLVQNQALAPVRKGL